MATHPQAPYTDEQAEYEHLCKIRGFGSKPTVKNRRVIVKEGNSVWYKGKEWVVVKGIGGPILELKR